METNITLKSYSWDITGCDSDQDDCDDDNVTILLIIFFLGAILAAVIVGMLW